MPYDGFGAYIHDHYPIVSRYPGTLESPEEITVTCPCGWSYESIASAGGGCDTNYMPWFEEHLEETL